MVRAAAAPAGGAAAPKDEEPELAAGFLSSALHLPQAELVKRLKKVAVALVNFPVDERSTAGVVRLAQELLQPALLGHEAADVREIVACCVVDSMRICAPNSPYSRGQIKSVFGLFARNLRALAEGRSPSEAAVARATHLLENMATVRVANVLVSLGDHDTLGKLFETLFRLAGANLEGQKSVDSLSLEVMVSALEEPEGVSRLVLTTILAQLLNPMKRTNPAGAVLAADVITRAQAVLEVPIAGFVKKTLVRLTLRAEAQARKAGRQDGGANAAKRKRGTGDAAPAAKRSRRAASAGRGRRRGAARRKGQIDDSETSSSASSDDGEDDDLEGGRGSDGEEKGGRDNKDNDDDDEEEEEDEQDVDGDEDLDDRSDADGDPTPQCAQLRLRSHRDVLALIEELLLRCPTVLLPLLVDLQELTEVEDAGKRADMVQLCGRVFAEHETGCARDAAFRPLLDAFLKRFNDVSAPLRERMCRLAAPLLRKHHDVRDLCASVDSSLMQRVEDRDEKVRAAAVSSVSSVAMEHPDLLSPELLRAVGGRVCDKKPAVRRAALLALGDLFNRHCTPFWRNGEAIPEAARRRFQWIPNVLLEAYTLDAASALLVESLVEEKLLDRHHSLLERVRCLVGLVSTLDERSEKVFRRMLLQKVRSMALVRSLLAIRAQRGTAAPDDPEWRAQLSSLARQVPGANGAAATAEALGGIFAHRDRHVLRELAVLANEHSTHAELRACKKELQRLLPSSSPLGDTCKRMLGRCSMAIFPGDALALVLQEALDLCRGANPKRKRAVYTVDVAAAVAKEVRGLLAPPELAVAWKNVGDLFELFQVPDERLQALSLELLARVRTCAPGGAAAAANANATTTHAGAGAGAGMSAEWHLLRDRVSDALRHVCESGPPRHAKLALQALHALSGPSMGGGNEEADEIVATSMRRAAAVLGAGPDTPEETHRALRVLQEAVRLVPAAYADVHADVADYVVQTLLPAAAPAAAAPAGKRREADEASETATAAALVHLVEAKRRGIKILARRLELLPGAAAAAAGPGVSGPAAAAADALAAQFRSAQQQASPVMRVLFGLVSSSSGAEVAGEGLPDEARGLITLTAAKATVRLLTQRRYLALLRPAQFRTLAGLMHSEAQPDRVALAKYVYIRTQNGQLPFRFSVFAALLGVDADREVVQAAHKQLLMMISHRRTRIHASVEQMRQAGRDPSAVSAQLLPELALVDLIHLLAHHPDFVLELDDDTADAQTRRTEVLNFFRRMIDFFMDALLDPRAAAGSPVGDDADVAGASAAAAGTAPSAPGPAAAQDLSLAGRNFGLMLQVLQAIKTHEDAELRPASEQHYVHVLADLALLSLRKKFQGREWSDLRHAGAVELPRNLFRASASADPQMESRQWLPAHYVAHMGDSGGVAATSLVGGTSGGATGAAGRRSAAARSPAKRRRVSAHNAGSDSESEVEGAAAAASASASARGPKKKTQKHELPPEAPSTRATLGRQAKAAAVAVMAAGREESDDEELEKSLLAFQTSAPTPKSGRRRTSEPAGGGASAARRASGSTASPARVSSSSESESESDSETGSETESDSETEEPRGRRGRPRVRGRGGRGSASRGRGRGRERAADGSSSSSSADSESETASEKVRSPSPLRSRAAVTKSKSPASVPASTPAASLGFSADHEAPESAAALPAKPAGKSAAAPKGRDPFSIALAGGGRPSGRVPLAPVGSSSSNADAQTGGDPQADNSKKPAAAAVSGPMQGTFRGLRRRA